MALKLKIQAAVRLEADADSWFNSLSKEQQQEYIELHPASKYADNVKSKDEEKPEEHQQKKKPYVPHNSKNHPKPKPKPAAQEDHHDMHEENHHAAGSQARRSIGQMIKAKAKGIVKHLKDEVKEAGTAGHAVTKLLRRKPLSDVEKHALKATAVRLAIVSISLAAGGGLAAALGEGVNMVAGELAKDFVKHGLVNAAEKTLMHSAVLASGDSDAGLQKMTEAFADYMANSPNVEKILAKGKAKAPTGDEDLDTSAAEAEKASNVAAVQPTYDNHMEASDLHSYAADEHKKKGHDHKHVYHKDKSKDHAAKARELS